MPAPWLRTTHVATALALAAAWGAATAPATASASPRTPVRMLQQPPGRTTSPSAFWRFRLPTHTNATCRVDRRAPGRCSSGSFRVGGLARGRHRFTLRLASVAHAAGTRPLGSFVTQTWVVVAPPPVAPPAAAPIPAGPAGVPGAPAGGPAAPVREAPAAAVPSPAVMSHAPEAPSPVVTPAASSPGPTVVSPEAPVAPAAQAAAPTPTPLVPAVQPPEQPPHVADAAEASVQAPVAAPAVTTQAAIGAPGRRLFWGAFVVGAPYGSAGNPPWDMSGLDAFEAHAGGKHVSILHLGQPWYVNGVAQPFYPKPLDAVRSRGAIPLIDWNSWDTANGGSETQPGFRLADIANGDHDRMIRAWAVGAKAWGKPLFLRFDHEMNGRWFPWSEIRNGNAAGDYAPAWRHVHDIFTSVGVTNVTWVWSPNVAFPGSLPLAGLYPGDAYVDWVGLDGYNWGTNPVKPSPWVTFSQLIGPTYATLGTIAPTKPVMIAEFASSEFGGSKAAWIADALSPATLDAFPRIGGILWFNWSPEGVDWSIESSPSGESAFAAAIASPRFAGGEFRGLAGTVVAPLGG